MPLCEEQEKVISDETIDIEATLRGSYEYVLEAEDAWVASNTFAMRLSFFDGDVILRGSCGDVEMLVEDLGVSARDISYASVATSTDELEDTQDICDVVVIREQSDVLLLDSVDVIRHEISEWWIVDSSVGSHLRREGEVVIDLHGIDVWGRVPSGLALHMDECIQKIARKLS